MKILLYIGHHKVGSTSLQAYFSQNWLALAQAGILYPMVEAEGLSDVLQRGLREADTPELPKINIREPHNALAFRMMTSITKKPMPPYHRQMPSLDQMLKTIRAQVRMLDPDTVVLCSEVMANLGPLNPKLITTLKKLFPKAEFEIYCSLRRPDQYLASWHGQRLKFGHRIDPLSKGGALAYRKGIHFDYLAMLRPWIEIFPEARIHLRNYADVLAAGGSVEDFTAEVSTVFPTDLPLPARTNPSLAYATYEIQRRGNMRLDRKGQIALRGDLLRLSAQGSLPANAQVELFGAETRAQLAEAFAPIAEGLATLTGNGAFFPDLDQITQVAPIPEDEATSAALQLLKTQRESTPETRHVLKTYDAPLPDPAPPRSPATKRKADPRPVSLPAAPAPTPDTNRLRHLTQKGRAFLRRLQRKLR